MNRIIAMNHSAWGQRELEPSPGLPIDEPIFYWWVEKRTRKGWSFVRDMHTTKEEAGAKFVKLYSAPRYGYRLHRMASFS